MVPHMENGIIPHMENENYLVIDIWKLSHLHFLFLTISIDSRKYYSVLYSRTKFINFLSFIVDAYQNRHRNY